MIWNVLSFFIFWDKYIYSKTLSIACTFIGFGNLWQDVFKGGITRRSHKRACQKKTLSDSVRQLQATKGYLTSIGVTWPAFQKMHSRLGFFSLLSHHSVLDVFSQKKMLLKTVHFQYIAPLKNDDFGSNKRYPPSDLFWRNFLYLENHFVDLFCGALTRVLGISSGEHPTRIVTSIL